MGQSRFYDLETGRFLNADTVEYLDPESINGLNLYAYCGNNPIMNVDPTGHAWYDVLAAIGLVLVGIAAIILTCGAAGLAIGGIGMLGAGIGVAGGELQGVCIPPLPGLL